MTCPCCGHPFESDEVMFNHVREEHPDAFAELSGLEVVEPGPERETALDLVEMVERITARAGRRSNW